LPAAPLLVSLVMFVVVSIAPGVVAVRGAPGVRSFVTPTVVFFATVLCCWRGGRSRRGLDVVAGAVILLLVIGIRNAWDLVLWMAQQHHVQNADKP
jgi:hypothetical protein